MTRLTIHKAAQLAQAGIGVRVYPDGTWETVRLDTSESAGCRGNHQETLSGSRRYDEETRQ